MASGFIRAWGCAVLFVVAGCGADDGAPASDTGAPAPPDGAAPPAIPPGGGEAPPGEVPAPPPAPVPPLGVLDPSFRAWFRLDVSALPVEQEDRFVSPTSHVVRRQGGNVVLEARARVADTSGALTDVAATWTASDPRMVAVTPRRGLDVQWEVRLEGRSTVAVRHGAQTRLLTVVAAREGEGWRVEILQ